MQLILFDGLRQVVVHPGLHQLLFLPVKRVGGDGDHRRLLLMRKVANQLAGANAVHIRHLNIHQNQIQLHLLSLLYGALAAITQRDVLDQIFQQHADKLQVRRIIIYRHHRHR